VTEYVPEYAAEFLRCNQPLDAVSERSSTGALVHVSDDHSDGLSASSRVRAEKQYVWPGDVANVDWLEVVPVVTSEYGPNPESKPALRWRTSNVRASSPPVHATAMSFEVVTLASGDIEGGAGGSLSVTVFVGADEAELDPPPFVAVTVTSIVWP
jgi:hypothetical protein